jgi:PAS domain S-box-containing protein
MTITMNFLGTLLKRNLQEKSIRKKYQLILEESFDGFLLTDGEGQITYGCPSASILTGVPGPQLLNLNFPLLLHPEDVTDFQRQFKELVSGLTSSITTRKRLRSDNEKVTWVEIRIKNMLNNRDVKSIIYYLTNITMIIDRERQQEDFVNIASHELKSPITAMNGYLQLVKRRCGDGSEDLNKVIRRMDVQLHKMQSIVSAMLDNTKINSCEVQYNYESFDLNYCIRETVDAIKINNDSHEVTCSFESPKRLVTADEEKIGRVLTNLITNAIKYSPDGKAVELATSIDSGYVKVTITDHGIGIAKEKQAHLFERFYRVDNLSKQMPGLGLGLFIASDIIHHHEGAIGVESIPGDGSSFWFTLPLADHPLN